MARTFKATITALIIAGAAAGLRAFVEVPYSCNVLLKRATDRLDKALSLAAGDLRAPALARQTMNEMQACVSAGPDDVAGQMVLAAACRMLGHNQRAAAAYETALLYDRRPELYLNLGQTQLAIGDSQSGVKNLTQACIYNPSYLDDIGEHQPEVKHTVDLYQLEMLKKQNP